MNSLPQVSHDIPKSTFIKCGVFSSVVWARGRQVECPDDLYDALANTWSEEKHSQYSVLSDIILDDDDATLFNTFYR